jgi:hypothetical protein
MVVMHLGQGMELYWRDENIKAKKNIFVHVPTEQEYLDIIVKSMFINLFSCCKLFFKLQKLQSNLFY